MAPPVFESAKSGLTTGVQGCGKVLKGFRDFVLRGNVIDLAVALVVGNAFTALVTSFVTAFVTPLIALIGGARDYNSLAFRINKTEFVYGLFLTALISFFIIAFVCYFFLVLPTNTLLAKVKQVTTKDWPFCCSKVPLKATRCPQCTSQLEAAERHTVIVDKMNEATKDYIAYTD